MFNAKGLILFGVFSSFILIEMSGLTSIVPGINHVVLLLFAIYLFLFFGKHNYVPSLRRYLLCLTALVFVLIMSTQSYSYFNWIGIIGLFFFIIPFINFLSVCRLKLSKKEMGLFINLFLLSVSFFALTNLIYYFLNSEGSDVRVFFQDNKLYFIGELSRLTTLLVFSTVVFLFKFNSLNRGILTVVLLSIFLLLIFFTIKKSIISFLIVCLIYIYSENRPGFLKVFKTIGFLLFGTFSIYLILQLEFFSGLRDNIYTSFEYDTNVNAEDHVRYSMYFASFDISLSFFPLGSGIGTFGSLLSVINYSDLYYTYGINLIGMNSELDVSKGAHTLLDTFWPHVIAEAGLIGLFLYLFLFFYPLKMAFKLRADHHVKFLLSSVSFLIFFEGFVLYTPEIPMFVFIYTLLIGYGYSEIFEAKL